MEIGVFKGLSAETREKFLIQVFCIMYMKQMMGVFFVAMRLFGEKAAWVHQAHGTEQFTPFYIVMGLVHHEKQTSCT